MKITDKNASINLEAYTRNIKNNKKSDTNPMQTSDQLSCDDKVVLSPKVKQIKELEELLGSVPDIDEEKVARIKKRIENGTYRIEGDKIALKMLKESLFNRIG